MSADVARVDAAKRQEGAGGVECQLGVRHEIAAVIVGQERLPPLARPLHGPTDAPEDSRLEIGALRRDGPISKSLGPLVVSTLCYPLQLEGRTVLGHHI